MQRRTHGRRKTYRRTLIALGAGVASLAAAPAAMAATAEVIGDYVRYTADPGEANQVQVTGTATTVVIDDVVAINDGDGAGGCEVDPADTTVATCQTAPPGGAFNFGQFLLGDSDDSFAITGAISDGVSVEGGEGSDVLTGGPGTDFLQGGAGNDTLRGQGGSDTLYGDCGGYGLCGGSDGDDILEGGDGDDSFAAEGGKDDYSGGLGFDFFQANTGSAADPHPVTISLDDQANDGRAGEGDQVRSDVEDVWLTNEAGGTIVGSGGTNSLLGSIGNDTLDGGGGNDFLSGNSGDDTINSRDGFADRVQCGPGNDTANVDSLDEVSTDCETVNRVDVGNANEDRPPTVSWVSPAAGASLSTSSVNVLQVEAGDDRGVSKVQFIDDDRIVCEDAAAPYTCDYRPRAEDVGRNTLIAVAIDTSQQTATATRTVSVPRFDGQLSSRTRPGRDRKAPYRFTTSGRLALPTGVTQAQGCKGRVTVQIKAGKKTVSNRRVRLRSDCTFRSRVRFTLPRRLRPSRLRVFTTFQGNSVLNPDRAPRRTVRVR